ncbi:hypothetical protein DFH08DRAFT_236255 [Mycena albidolilacea]|uniref:Uncharacterized protein n=1 Tax=Mycena albidolilacea TaxID=1033008 RepID=A0AAD7EQD1_9AGAR|nr:hypothetical protein DFH08DRAFT_236255 [Mycena albidolilacea]
MTQPNPLLIPELAEQCIAHLVEWRADLKACALVSKSWVFAAQVHLFGAIYLDKEDLCRRLETTLRASPHFIQHVRRLGIRRYGIRRYDEAVIPVGFLDKICNFPFTHLSEASIESHYLTMAAAGALRPLLGLPTLRYVKIYTARIELLVFLSLWGSCSPSIRHLHLSCSTTSDDPSHLIGGHPSSRIPLKSLRLGPSNNINIYNWLSHDLCPFDLAMLTVLSIDYTSILDWRAMAPALRTLEILQFTVLAGSQPVDLSPFSNLSVIRIYLNSPNSQSVAHNTLATITPSSHVRRIILYPLFSSLPGIHAPPLDSTLARLHLQHPLTVEFEMGSNQYERWVPRFPQLNARNMLRRAAPDLDWIDKCIRKTDILH